jgi:hypothetical protein
MGGGPKSIQMIRLPGLAVSSKLVEAEWDGRDDTVRDIAAALEG